MFEIILVLIIFILYIYMNFEKLSNAVTYVKSEIDGKDYLVQNLNDKQIAANMLSSIKDRILKFIKYLRIKYPDDKNIKRLEDNFNPDVIMEGFPDGKYTSYSVNKGEKIVFCVRQRDNNNSLVDINTLMFVAIHELSHLMTESIGHTQEFWDNMKFLLKESISPEINTYIYKPYHKEPKEYCGTVITDTPLKI